MFLKDLVLYVHTYVKEFVDEWPFSRRRIWPIQWYHDARIWIRDLIFPHNVIKIKQLDRHWCDRDEVLFHAMFQVLCDFVEKEKPFISYYDPTYFTRKKPTLEQMWKHINEHLDACQSLEKYIAYHYEDKNIENLSDYEKTDAQTSMQIYNRQYNGYRDILKLYEWYTVSRPNTINYLSNIINTYKFGEDGKLNMVYKDKDGKDLFITMDEYHEIEKENELIDNIMMRKLLYYRRWLWT